MVLPDIDPLLPVDLPAEQTLALAHASGGHRTRLAAFLKLDRRLGQFVSQSKEIMLTQMRIAWWRDQLAKPVIDRPTGDVVLDALGVHWAGEETALTALVDGWEALLAQPPLPDEAALEFVGGRASCFAGMARLAHCDPGNASHCGVIWAFADLAAKISDAGERSVVVDLARDQCSASLNLPYALRSLSILGRLGQRALARGGGVLIAGRGDVLQVIRLGLLGR